MTRLDVVVNGTAQQSEIEPRTLLVYYLREVLGLTGTKVGCDTSTCGSCTIHVDGRSVKSCTMLAVQADGHDLTTIEGLATDGELHPLQRAFHEHHGLQCGYCTPGMLLSATYLLSHTPKPSEEEIRKAILITPGMNQYNVATAEEYLSAISPTRLPYMSTAINVVVGIALVIGFLVIFQSMYTAVMERTREIGVLKSLGASRLYIITLVLRETGTIAAVGIVLGVVASYALSAALQARFPTLDFVINLPWVWKAVVIAFAGSVLGAVYPAYKAASKDPIDALAYE